MCDIYILNLVLSGVSLSYWYKLEIFYDTKKAWDICTIMSKFVIFSDTKKVGEICVTFNII